jgi:choline dehydrogenase-like flavoprotein
LARETDRHGLPVANMAYSRCDAVPNLYVADGSVLPTQGSANPALTIVAMAARADGLITRSRVPGTDRATTH